jgi:hypothetical protein
MANELATVEPSSTIILPLLSVDDLAKAFRKFEEFKSRLLTEEDSVNIQGKTYLKKSAWRKWALACGVSDEMASIERIPATGEDDKANFQYRITVKAFHVPTRRSAVGVAVASKSEKKSWAHLEHDVFSLCHTRAKNRAISDLVGGGEVSVEELDTEVVEPGKPVLKQTSSLDSLMEKRRT